MDRARPNIVAASAAAANVPRRPRPQHIDDPLGGNLGVAGRSWQIVASSAIGNYELVFAAAFL
jgi:hypothetical protein